MLLASREGILRLSPPPQAPLGPHLLVPLLLFTLATLWLVPLHGDLWIADRIYAWEGYAWALRDAYVTQSLVHVTGRNLSVLAWLAVAALYAATWRLARLRAWRRPLLYLLVAVALGAGTVSALKHLTNVDCPWDIERYGGSHPYMAPFVARPSELPRGECFPAGHASAGYAWLALYFFFMAARPAWRWRGLAVGLLAGATFGISQQLRGAHFLSHDLFALMVCWTVALVAHRVFWPASRSSATAQPLPARQRRTLG